LDIIKKIQAQTVGEVDKSCIEAIPEYGNGFKTIMFDTRTEFCGC
jgi:hypothetical protein